MVLVVPKFHSITRSFSRKVQIKQYEPVDFFSSHGEQIPDEEATPELVAEISAKLYKLAKTDVEQDIQNYMNAPAEGALTAEDLDGVRIFIQMLALGKNKEEINKAIIEVKDKLNEGQLQFCRNIIKTL